MIIEMKWKEDDEKHIPKRTYSLPTLKDIMRFILKYFDDEKQIEWLKMYIGGKPE